MNIFGTDGVRNRMGQGLFTLENLPKLGSAIALWAQQKYGSNSSILLASDTRISCDFVKSALTSGLLLSPITITDAGILPTPALAQILAVNKKYSLGIMISASHNPYYDNGIKLIDSLTGKLSLQDELTISTFFNQINSFIDYNNFGREESLADASAIYIQTICSLFSSNFLYNKTIILDTAHGATYLVAPAIFKALGATVIIINNNPDGTNINAQCGATDLASLKKNVCENKGDIGFAFDGDGDRLMLVSSSGETKNGDDILALLSQHRAYKDQKTVVATVMCNQGLEVFLQKAGKELLRTSVGDKYVVQALQENNFLLGGEQSGHIILKDLATTGDGILAALRICEVLEETNNWGLNTFEKYPQVLLNIRVGNKKDLTSGQGRDIITTAEKHIVSGRILVRYSGTENLLRVMVEEKDLQKAETIAHNLAQELKDFLS